MEDLPAKLHASNMNCDLLRWHQRLSLAVAVLGPSEYMQLDVHSAKHLSISAAHTISVPC